MTRHLAAALELALKLNLLRSLPPARQGSLSPSEEKLCCYQRHAWIHNAFRHARLGYLAVGDSFAVSLEHGLGDVEFIRDACFSGTHIAC